MKTVIPVGVLFSQTGATSVIEKTQLHATLLAVDEAMAKLAKEDPDSAEFIKLRFFVGLTNEEAAQALGIPERTARRHWSFARAWLHRELLRQGQA